VVWTQWKNPDPAQGDAVVKYHRWDVAASDWSGSVATISDLASDDYLSRNLSVAADSSGNVYAVWDHLHINKTQYVIGYSHSGDSGDHWRLVHTYLQGNQDGLGAVRFDSAEDHPVPEYAHFLRPYITLVTSGTLPAPVPVLSWHRRTPDAAPEPGLARALSDRPYKVLWTFATQPGSNPGGYMYWKTQGGRPFSMTLSTDYWGEVNTAVDSATARLALVGDLGQILDEEGSSSDRLHAVYHERTSGEFWEVFYNTNRYPPDRFDIYMPLVIKNASSGGGG
jgi:hypothetical protein